MPTDLPISSSINLFEHLIERALYLRLSAALNISVNGPSRTLAGEFNCFDVTRTWLGNAGRAGTSPPWPPNGPPATPPLVDHEILLPDNCVVTVWPNGSHRPRWRPLITDSSATDRRMQWPPQEHGRVPSPPRAAGICLSETPPASYAS